MAKPVFLRSKSFQVTDCRRGEDFYNRDFDGLLSLFRDNAWKFEELISMVLEGEEFDTPKQVRSLDIRLMGRRKSFLGQAHRGNGYIKMTPHREHLEEGQDIKTFVHELAHIACPVMYDYYGRATIHGKKFKSVAYKIAKRAYAVGLLTADQVSWDIGMASVKAPAGPTTEAAAAQTSTTSSPWATVQSVASKFRVGDVVCWKHNGHKHGGSYTGRVERVNRKTLSILELTKNGVERYGAQWKFGRAGKGLKLVE